MAGGGGGGRWGWLCSGIKRSKAKCLGHSLSRHSETLKTQNSPTSIDPNKIKFRSSGSVFEFVLF